jgi:hypothetical protein
MTTIAIPTYSFARGLSGSLVRHHFYGDGTEFSGPTPFEIPERVMLTVEDREHMTFEFEYSDREQPEDSWRRALADGTASALLAQTSKKILRLRFTGWIGRHLEAHFGFDQQAIISSGERFPRRSQMSLERNASVVKRILASTPDEVLEQLRSLAGAPASSVPQ